jgi:hypothetical protein
MEDTSIKMIVSMIAKPDGIMLFTELGEVLTLKHSGPYDVAQISEYLTPKLTGTDAVEINMDDYSSITKALKSLPEDLDQDGGITIVQIINGREVEGVFYPKKMSVNVTTTDKVTGEKETVDIPHVEHLEKHIKRAVAENSASVKNFLKRIAPVIKSRRHSGEDLMQFIQLSEMPLTEDGQIIAYKRVYAEKDGHFVDCYTRRVRQRVGSRVTMPVGDVDPDRARSCSTGLHVANYGYVRTFSGDTTLIVLVRPEDFIAVPHLQNTKARVSSYHIIGTMTDKANVSISMAENQTHMTGDTTLEELISQAITGTVYPAFEEVFVSGHGNIDKVVPLLDANAPVAVKISAEREKAPSGKSLMTDEPKKKAKPSDILAQAKKDSGQSEKLPLDVEAVFLAMLENKDTKAEIARKFVTSTRTIGRWIEKYDYDAWAAAQSIAQPGIDEQVQAEIDTNDGVKEATQEELEATDQTFPDFVVPTEGTIAEQARIYFQFGKMVLLREFKKAKKKSWAALGFTAKEIGQIEKD